MSNASSDLFDVSAPHEHPATESHSLDNDGEGQWRYARKMARAKLRAFNGVRCLTVGIFANMFLASPLMTQLVAPAQAQEIPKSLEQGGTDAALKQRRNAWTVGVAGGQLSGTYMTLADELAEVLDDGDNLRVIPITTYGAASNLDDLLYLRGVDVASSSISALKGRPSISSAEFITSVACPSQRCTSLRAPTSKPSRICAAKRSASGQQEVPRA